MWLGASLAAGPALAVPALDPMFTDHAMIQRDRPIHVRGRAEPGEQVTVRLGSATARATAGANGLWTATLPAMKAGGPFALTASSAAGEARATDILVGDVWLCSGQSNMEWPLRNAMGGEGAAATANDPKLRLLTVPQRTALAPEALLPGDVKWQAATADTAPHFSAVCYAMVRELRAAHDVPIGAINASWGGTRIRPWMDEATARSVGYSADADLLALYRSDPAAAARQFSGQWESWWRSKQPTEPWRNSGALQWNPVPAMTYWNAWKGSGLDKFDGLVWARKRFTLTAEEAAKGATLSLGVIDDYDQTWVNGVGIGNSFGWSFERNYKLPAGVLKAGENEIVVNIGDDWGPGGFQGPADKFRLVFADGSSKPLGEGWEYSLVKANVGKPPQGPWQSHTGLSTIYNAMIAPLGPLGLKGVAWYQGESDVGIPGYDARLAAMMRNWRAQFGSPRLPFHIVALAGFGKPSAAPVASGWAELIDQQRRAVAADSAAALVVATDLGEPEDIHPVDKIELGQRLALAARKLAYGEQKLFAGPVPTAATRTTTGVAVAFTGAKGALQSLSGAPLGFELCAETQDSCRFSTARIEGATVVLQGDGRPVTRVRHAWADYPLINVYDQALLPVPPFELAVR